jgi:hypothetical protein
MDALVIMRLRQAVMIALALACVVVSSVVLFLFDEYTESSAFHKDFQDASDKVLDVFPERSTQVRPLMVWHWI